MVNSTQPIVAIFGGSFDPIHNGHKAIIHKAQEQLDISKIIIIPTYLNPFKSSSLISSHQRLAFVKRVLDDLKDVEIEDYEVKSKESLPTYQTISYLQKRYCVKYIIIGADNLKDLKKWYQFSWLNDNFIWVIATRKGYNYDYDFLKHYQILEIEENVSSSEIREGLKTHKIDTSINEYIKNMKD